MANTSNIFVQMQLLLAAEATSVHVDRRLWRKHRNKMFFEEMLWPSSDEDFKANLRVSRATFTFLCKELHDALVRMETRITNREPISVERRIAAALWWLGSSSEYRTVAYLFGVATSTLCEIIHEFCAEVCRKYMRKLIRLPTG